VLKIYAYSIQYTRRRGKIWRPREGGGKLAKGGKPGEAYMGVKKGGTAKEDGRFRAGFHRTLVAKVQGKGKSRIAGTLFIEGKVKM